jgi:glycosyltransferase involved in cell wall biosynthesis
LHIHHLELRFPFAYFASKKQIPIVTTVHSLSSIKFSTPIHSKFYRKLIIENLKLSQNLIFVSKFVEFEFEQYFGKFKYYSQVIPNPIDAKKFFQIDKREAKKKINLSSEIPLILFIGRLIKRKGVYTLLEALKILKERRTEFQVIIIGDGPELNNLAEYIRKNNLTHLVSIHKNISHSQLLYYYNAADLFVMPSFSESFGLVFVEAMLCGVPVIGTTGVTRELIPSEDYGFRIPVNNSNALAEVIEKAMHKKWNSEKIIEYACSFAWEKRIVEFERIYRYIANENKFRKAN